MLAVPVADTLSAPTQVVLPRVHGNAAAARSLATVYREAADEVDACVASASSVVAGVGSSWSGTGYDAVARPAAELTRNGRVVSRGLREAADAFEALARRLERAHEQHGWSLGRLAAVGAIVAVTTAAVVVTMGAAAPAEAAVVAVAVEGAEAAAGAAAAASAGAAAELGGVQALFAGLRPLLTWAAPHLAMGEGFAGVDAAIQELTRGRVDWSSVAIAGGTGFTGSAGAKVLGGLLGGTGIRAAAGRSAAWGGSAAVQSWLDDGSLSGGDLALAAVSPDLRALRALKASATLDEWLMKGVRLSEHEAPHLGHTIQKHVGKSWCFLQARAQVERAPYRSSFFDLQQAEWAVNETLAANEKQLRAKIATGLGFDLELRHDLDVAVGGLVGADGTVTPASTVLVMVRHNKHGLHVRTAYLDEG